MVFSSLLFLFRFLPVLLIVYFVAPRRYRNGVLFLGSLIFYGWGEPVYISLLLFSTLVDYIHGRLVWRFMEEGKQQRARLCVASSVIINLGLLGVFKYADFLMETVGRLFGIPLSLPGLALPIGISFYTFQTMSYTIDIYRKEAAPQKNIIDFGAYVSMFPQLIAGPIVRYHTIAEELQERTENFAGFSRGVFLFTVGLGKKVLIANTTGALWTQISGVPDAERTVLMMWLGILAFGMQIYFDFSGYSDMAMGLGAMMGFHFPENFRYPYTAKSITDFWRRWHITLSTWFKEYVYIPLGGNRKGAAVQIRNILIVWLLTGIWHGAAWNYLLWGLYFGVLLLLEKLLLKPYLEKLPSPFRSAYAMIFVFLGWVLFAHEDMGGGLRYLMQMAGAGGIAFTSRRTWYLLVTSLPLIAASVLGSTPLPGTLCRKMKGRVRETAELLFVAVVLVLSVAFLVDASYNPFLYFRF
ncbi:MBOAT family O-acyltransferase [Hungatella hathewayi]